MVASEDRGGAICVNKVVFRENPSKDDEILTSASVGQVELAQAAFPIDRILVDLLEDLEKVPTAFRCHLKSSKLLREGLLRLAIEAVRNQSLLGRELYFEVLNFSPTGAGIFQNLFKRRTLLAPQNSLLLGEMADHYLLYEHAEKFMEEACYHIAASPELKAVSLGNLALLMAEKGKRKSLPLCCRASRCSRRSL